MQLALARTAQRRDDFRVIPVLLPGARPGQLSGFLGLHTWVDFREGIDSEAAFSRLVAGIQGQAPLGDAFALPDEPAPYRGLLAFDEAHSAYFFGREPDIERTLEKLGHERFVAVVGASGCGKSSLVLSGVLPRLKQPGGILGPGVHSWTMRPGDRPLRALSDALAASEPPGAQRLALSDSLHKRFLESPDGLRTALATLTADSPMPCVLVVNQLEELFTHAPQQGGVGEIEAFAANLRNAALTGSGTLRILATLRADFFERCLSVAPLRELLQDRQVLLGSLGDEALREVILRPAQKVGAYLEKGLLTAILKDVSHEPGALPLLEDALDQLWRARSGTWLTLAAYEASGGISQALQRRAQACYEALPPEERTVARLVLVRLASLGEGREDTRRRVPLSELSFPGVPNARVEHVLHALSEAGARLIVASQDSVEVAHEVLIRTWTTLQKWLEEDRSELRLQRRLEEAANEWSKKERSASYLYSGARLLDAEELFKHKPAFLNHLEREFLDASIQLRDQQKREEEERTKREFEATQRSARHLRNLAIILSLAVATVFGGAILLYRQTQIAEENKRRAEENSQRADHEKRVAFSRELALSARQNIREDPQRALLLLQEAQRLAPVDNLREHLDAWGQEPGLLVLRGDEGDVVQAAFSPDGMQLLTASWDDTARLWDARSGKPLGTFQGYPSSVQAAAISSKDVRVLTTSRDGTTLLWGASSDKPLAILHRAGSQQITPVFSPDGSLILTNTLDLWDTSSGKLVTTLWGRSGKTLMAAAVSHDHSRILATYFDGTAHLWDVSSGKSLITLPLDSNFVDVTALSPNGSLAVMASSDEDNATLWDTSSGKPLAPLQGDIKPVLAAAFSPDGSRVATASEDGTVRLWDTSSRNLLLVLQGHSRSVGSVAFSPDGSRILTASKDGTARLWDTSSGKPLATRLYASDLLAPVVFSPDGSHVFTASKDGTAYLRDSSSGKLLATLQGHSGQVWTAAFNSDGSRVLTTAKDKTARLWDASSGKSLSILRDLPDWGVSTAVSSQDGSRVLIVSLDKTARLWDVSSAKPLATLHDHASAASAGAFSPDGLRVLTGSKDGTARLWEASSGKLLVTLQGHSEPVTELAFSPDGSRIITASHDSTARLWDASSGSAKVTLKGHTAEVTIAVFSPDGSRIITASRDDSAHLWDASSGKHLATLLGHSSRVKMAVFSPDSSRVLTTAFDNTTRVWDASSGKHLATFPSHGYVVKAATFSPDAAYVITAFEDSLSLWPSWRWDPEAFAKLDVGRPLTCEERRTFLHEKRTCTEDPAPLPQEQHPPPPSQ